MGIDPDQVFEAQLGHAHRVKTPLSAPPTYWRPPGSVGQPARSGLLGYPRSRHPRLTCTHAAFRALVMPNGGRCSLAWLSADPYIPVAVTIATTVLLSRGTRNADSVCVLPMIFGVTDGQSTWSGRCNCRTMHSDRRG